MTQAGDHKITVCIDPDLRDLVPGFLQNRRNDVNTLQQALDAGDFMTILTLGHRMRGDGGGYGFQMISDIGRRIERAAKEEDVVTVMHQVDALSQYLDRIEVVYG